MAAMVARSLAFSSAPTASRPSSLNSRSASGSTRSPRGGSSTATHSTRSPRPHRGASACICCMTHTAVIESREAQLVGQVLHDVIRVEREGAVVTLTIAHAPANAVNGDVVNGLAVRPPSAESDETCRALVITGSGPKFFSAGADIKEFGGGAEAVGKA